MTRLATCAGKRRPQSPPRWQQGKYTHRGNDNSRVRSRLGGSPRRSQSCMPLEPDLTSSHSSSSSRRRGAGLRGFASTLQRCTTAVSCLLHSRISSSRGGVLDAVSCAAAFVFPLATGQRRCFATQRSETTAFRPVPRPCRENVFGSGDGRHVCCSEIAAQNTET